MIRTAECLKPQALINFINMKIGYELKLKRRRTGHTDYRKRLKLLLSRKQRLVVRKSLRHIRVQLATYDSKGDSATAMAVSSELEKFGWNYSTSSLPAAYLTGLLCGIRAKSKGVTEAVLDLGVNPPIKGSKLYAALKGAIDGGLKVPANLEILPADDRIKGTHIAAYAGQLKKTSPEIFKKRFSAHLKKNADPEKIPQVFDQVKKKIMEAK